jgi:hypothetical protein
MAYQMVCKNFCKAVCKNIRNGTSLFWNRHHKFAAVAALWLSDGVARLWLSTSERVTQVRQCYGYPFLDTLFTWILEHMNHAWAVPDPA